MKNGETPHRKGSRLISKRTEVLLVTAASFFVKVKEKILFLP